MNWMALVIFIAALAGGFAFEAGYAWMDRRWTLPYGRDLWGVIFWSGAMVVLISCGLMPWPLRHCAEWTPFFFVGGIHVLITIVDPEWLPERQSSLNTNSPSTHPPVGNTAPGHGPTADSPVDDKKDLEQSSNAGN
jgi:hypothetical protein